MKFQIVHPSGFLKNYIRYYCFMESEYLDGNIVERVIPTESVQLMFHYKNPFVVLHADDSVLKQPRSLLSGLSDSFADVSTNGEAGVVFVDFHPTGACHFFKFPLSEIENQSVDLSDVFNAEIREVEELLYLHASIEEKVIVIENFLLSRYSPIHAYDRLLIQKGVEIVKNCKGQATAAFLAGNLATTTKTLERKFSVYLGTTPKQLIKLVRFQEILKDFSVNRDVCLTERAYRNGYFDQSHFIKDFKTYSGYTPKDFLSKYPDYSIYAESC